MLKQKFDCNLWGQSGHENKYDNIKEIPQQEGSY